MQNKKLTFTVEEATKRLEHYCVYQDRCHDEVNKKLQEMHMIPEACEQIVLHLMAHNFLNEERFAKSFARGKFNIKHWGKNRIVRELKFRDISEYHIKIALQEIDGFDYDEKLRVLTQKKFDTVLESNIYKKRKKIQDFLIRKGYEFDKIQTVLTNIFNAEN